MSDYLARISLAEQRIEHGNRERTAGADDKARAIAEEVARRGRGGQKVVADELGVSEKTVSQAVARARTAGDPFRALPHDTFDRLLAAERSELPPLPARHWQVLAQILRGIDVDVDWLEGPGHRLAGEVEDLEDEYDGAAGLADACRSWSRVQALAVIDALQRDDTDALPAIVGAP
jgi:hypothetical protein